MDVHSSVEGVTATQLREAHERDLVIEAEEGVHFERAWLDPESGKVFCLSDGPSKETRRSACGRHLELASAIRTPAQELGRGVPAKLNR